MGRYLAIDYGKKRVGLAMSDPLGMTAQPLDTVKKLNENDDSAVIKRLEEICAEKDIDKIIIGYPKQLDGTIGIAAQKVEEFAKKLDPLGKPFEFQDERMTTALAEKTLISADVSRKNRKNSVDKIAAVLILQSYLDRK